MNRLFDKLNLDNCYWGGFLAADGCIMSPDKTHSSLRLQLKLASKDKKHLITFAKFIKYKNKISHYDNYYSLSVTDTYLCNKLNTNFNITPRKTFTYNPPNLVKTSQIKSFIIGYLDGDGSIWFDSGYLAFSIVGNLKTITWIREHFLKFYNISLPKISKDGSIFRLKIKGKKAKLILSDLNKIKVSKLKRKWNKLKEIK